MSTTSKNIWHTALNGDLTFLPFVHSKVPHVFREGEYLDLLRHWPDGENFQPFSNTGRVPKGPSDARRVFVLGGSQHDRLPYKARDFWNDFHDRVAGSKAKDVLLGRLRKYAATSDLEEIKSCGFDIDVLLMTDDAGYALPPHTDAPYKLFTFLIYCGDHVEFDGFDTVLYETEETGLLGARELHHDRRKFREFDRVKYKSNSGFFFLRSDNSFHGVEAVPEVKLKRELIMITGYIGGLPTRFEF